MPETTPTTVRLTDGERAKAERLRAAWGLRSITSVMRRLIIEAPDPKRATHSKATAA
jgi:hypothetical protein